MVNEMGRSSSSGHAAWAAPSAAPIGFDSSYLYGGGLPPMPGSLQADEMRRQTSKPSSGPWGAIIGSLVGVAALTVGGALAYRYRANLGINSALRAIREKGFGTAVKDAFSDLGTKFKGFDKAKVSEWFSKKWSSAGNWFQKKPTSTPSA